MLTGDLFENGPENDVAVVGVRLLGARFEQERRFPKERQDVVDVAVAPQVVQIFRGEEVGKSGRVREDVSQGDLLCRRCRKSEPEFFQTVVERKLPALDLLHHQNSGKELVDRPDPELGVGRIGKAFFLIGITEAFLINGLTTFGDHDDPGKPVQVEVFLHEPVDPLFEVARCGRLGA